MADSPSRLATFLSELKRRRVYRVAIVYAGVAFVIIQLADYAFEQFNVSSEFGRFLTIVLALGFLIVIALAWAFDITDEGIVRAKGRPAGAKRKAQPLLGNKSLAVIAVLAIIVAVWALLREPSPTGGSVIRSLAVLPLENQMGDPEQGYVVDGVHEALTREMSTLSALRVIGRTSTKRYKENPPSIPEIAEELDVDAVVEGSVFRSPIDETISITVQLVATKPERHIFSKEYVGDLADILSIHKTIIREIAEELGLTLTPDEEERLASAPQVDPVAYDFYIKGWELRLLETNESITKAIEYLEQAVELDSTFAPAWAALAASYQSRDRARMFEALDRALELDPDNVVALTWQAFTQYGYMREGAIRDNPGAKATFQRALTLEPGNVYARYEYGQFLLRYGQPHEALAELRLAQDLDPVNPLPLRGFVWVYNGIRQYDKALEYCRDYSELTGEELSGLKTDAEIGILMEQGRYAEAAALAEDRLWVQFRAEWALGNTEKVYAIRDSLVSIGQLPQQEQDSPMNYAHFYSIIGEKDKALDLLGDALVNVNQSTWGLKYNPEYDFLRAEPRYKILTQRHTANFPGYEWSEVFDQNGNLLQPVDETLEAYNAPGSR